MILEKFGPPGVGQPPPWCNVYYHNIQRSSLKPLPIKAKFYRKHLYKAGTNVYINTCNPCHITKMAAMPIYVLNPSKIFSGTDEQISRKLGM